MKGSVPTAADAAQAERKLFKGGEALQGLAGGWAETRTPGGGAPRRGYAG